MRQPHRIVHHRPRRLTRTLAASIGPVLCLAVALPAQQPATAGAAPAGAPSATSDSARDTAAVAPRPSRGWITRGDATAFGAAVLLTGLVAPFDHPVSSEFTEADWQRGRVQHVASDIAFFGGVGPFAASAVLAAASVGGQHPALERFALHDMEAIALATAINGIGKGLAGRALPGVSTRHTFSFGRGFHRNNGPFVAFPSGHTAAAFALAATISGEVAHDDAAHARLATRIAFAGAAAVGLARVVQRQHWPSDLPLAAVIGAWSGNVVQRHANDHGRVSAALRGLTLAPAPGHRTLIGWSSIGY